MVRDCGCRRTRLTGRTAIAWTAGSSCSCKPADGCGLGAKDLQSEDEAEHWFVSAITLVRRAQAALGVQSVQGVVEAEHWVA
jgi:hypothetical protein